MTGQSVCIDRESESKSAMNEVMKDMKDMRSMSDMRRDMRKIDVDEKLSQNLVCNSSFLSASH